jgi:hypothetical protein
MNPLADTEPTRLTGSECQYRTPTVPAERPAQIGIGVRERIARLAPVEM